MHPFPALICRPKRIHGQRGPKFFIVAAAVLLGSGFAARAGQQVVGINAFITGGGAVWNVRNDLGTTNGLPLGGISNAGSGFGITDARLDTTNQVDAFDNGIMVWVNDELFVAPAAPQITPISVAADPAFMSGLQVSVDYLAIQSDPILRTQAVFTNPSSSPITATITLTTNVGSDDGTQVIGTSSGDTTFTTADHWIITDDSSAGGGDPTNIHVLGGANTGPSAETGLTVFSNAGTQGVLARFSLTVPANSTRRLLFFNELSSSAGKAVINVTRYETLEPNNPLLIGLSEGAQAQVANFQINDRSYGRLVGSGTVGNSRNPFSVEAISAPGSNRAQLVYTDLSTRRTVRSVGINSVSRVGNLVQIAGTARINNGILLPFGASFVDNGTVGDTFRLYVAGIIVVGPTAIRTGGVQVSP